MTKTKRMVCGFMFRNSPNNISEQQVAMILKDHLTWCAGKLNGLGGKIDGMETPLNAMVREFAEEGGCETKPSDWREFCRMSGVNAGEAWEVCYFVCLTGDGRNLKRDVDSKETEQVGWYPLWQLIDQRPPSDPRLVVKLVPNCRWLIPLAIDKDGVFAGVTDDSCF